ncbi:hypothetical protein F4553_005723 [Allocatelliglobosispora scoriae]|uniref:Uncharacterized protein n=1 Tax=Allocatelliglobosispora scoriae TaxID=643052 RepID=A0A841BYV4_9ACTN|nr:hypothetical protein [Allocatelliglobosispora scoriae]MBB5872289.1 hypothetical protein [Allocatelliglobosispora scoriae]
MDQPSGITLADAAADGPPWARRIVILPTFAVLALVGGLLPSFSVVANLYVLVIGSVIAWIGFTRRLPQRTVPNRVGRGVLWWLLPIGVFVIFETTTFVGGSTYEYPTLSLLADPLLDAYLPRAALYFAWLAGFWGLCRR